MAEPNAYYAVARNPPNFNTLPPELRVKIIQEMFFPRTITLTYDIMVLGPFLGSCLTPNPTVLHISREIRAEALRYYHPVQPWDEHSVVYLNPLVDSLSIIADPKGLDSISPIATSSRYLSLLLRKDSECFVVRSITFEHASMSAINDLARFEGLFSYCNLEEVVLLIDRGHGDDLRSDARKLRCVEFITRLFEEEQEVVRRNPSSTEVYKIPKIVIREAVVDE